MQSRALVVLLLVIPSALAQQDNRQVSPIGSVDFDIQRTSTPQYGGLPANAFVSASDLAVPNRARKEFEKATDLVRRQELQEAIKKLNKAIHLYPQYAVAYNNMAVIYGQLGDHLHENEALQKAISVNHNFALGYVNLGRMEMKANNYPAAEPFLAKAAELNPADVNALVLLSYSEFMDKSFDAAIANTRKAHALQQPHAFAHRVAARAFEQESTAQLRSPSWKRSSKKNHPARAPPQPARKSTW